MDDSSDLGVQKSNSQGFEVPASQSPVIEVPASESPVTEIPVGDSPPVPESPLAKSAAFYSRRKSANVLDKSVLSQSLTNAETLGGINQAVTQPEIIQAETLGGIKQPVTLDEKSRHLKQTSQDSERVDLGSAHVVVTGGRALKSAENFKMVENLAENFGAADQVGVERDALPSNVVLDIAREIQSSVEDKPADAIDESNVDKRVSVVNKKMKVEKDLKVTRKRKGKQVVDYDEDEKDVKVSVQQMDVKAVKRQRKGKEIVKTEAEEKPAICVSQSTHLLKSRTTLNTIYNLMNDLKPFQKTFIEQIGFGSLLDFNKISYLPGKLSWYVADSFDPEKMVIKTNGGLIDVTSESVRDVFGIPFGGVKIGELKDVKDDTFVRRWKSQFSGVDIRPTEICNKIKEATISDFTFKMNFLMVFANTLGICESNGVCSFTVLNKVTEQHHLKNYDWCHFIIDCLRLVKKQKEKGFYVGPIVFLTLLYLDRTKFDLMPVVRMRPSFKSWKSSSLKEREQLEIENGGLGNVELRGINDEEEDEGFLNIEGGKDVHNEEADQLRSILAISTANKEGCFQKIRSLFSVIYELKPVLEATLDKAYEYYPEDGNTTQHLTEFYNMFKKKGNEKAEFTENVSGGGCEPENVGAETSKDIVVVAQADSGTENVKRSGKEHCKSGVRELSIKLNFGQGGVSEECNTQWAVKNIEQVLDSVETTIIGCVPFSQPIPSVSKLDGPTFDLGLSPDAEKVVREESPKTVALPPKRQIKPSLYVSSPYLNRKTVVETNTSDAELTIANSVFAMRGDKMETVFEMSNGLTISRIALESLAPSLNVGCEVVDAWIELLNYEEKNKQANTLSRFFFSTDAISPTMHHVDFDLKKELESFSITLTRELANRPSVLKIENIDLVFFCVSSGSDFYLFVFNLKKVDVHIIDNNYIDVQFNDKYQNVFRSVQLLFSNYLDSVGHRKASKIANAKPSIMKLKWATKNNLVDAGVFAMCHMENYTGQPVATWKIGLSSESEAQVTEIRNLRAKYVAKLVSHEVNIHKQKMIDLALEFESQFNSEERKLILENASDSGRNIS